MLISQNLNQNALRILSEILEAINRETESEFKVRPSASGTGIACRLLEARIAVGPHSVAVRFSEDLIFQIVDLMTAGAGCHFTKIVEKPFTTFELSVLEYLLTQAFGMSPAEILDLGKTSKSTINNMNAFSFTVTGPKSEGVAYVMPSSISFDVLYSAQPNTVKMNNSISDLNDLRLNILAEILRYELPQTCALALQMMTRESAALLLKMLPWELQQDVGVRFVTMGEAHAVAKELLIRACCTNPGLHLKIAQ